MVIINDKIILIFLGIASLIIAYSSYFLNSIVEKNKAITENIKINLWKSEFRLLLDILAIKIKHEIFINEKFSTNTSVSFQKIKTYSINIEKNLIVMENELINKFTNN